MSNNTYIESEVDKIIGDKNLEFPLNLAMTCAWIMGNFKGINLKVLDVKKRSSLSDYFIIGSATNSTQAQAMADAILVQIKRHGHTVLSSEGRRDSDWILIDFGDVMAHIFIESARSAYALEQVWGDGNDVEIPQEYYFAGDDGATNSGGDNKGYF
jgi:ribosome-associated protein